MEINTSEMIKFYEAFDAVDFKYHLFLFDGENATKTCADYDERYLKYQKHEYAYQFSELTKKSYGSVRANLDLVYAKREMTDSVIKIYDLVMHKLMNQYINIDGIERMFSEKYADFEWDMHMGIDYNKHSMKFYRDHFIHQVRDAYMMHKLLEDGFEELVMKILDNEANSKISRFVCKQLLQQMEKKDAVIDAEDEIVRQHYLRNIIYMSCYMSALFHDIGYPETANMANRRRITDYISSIYNFETSYSDFNRISTLLQNSLLFRVVSLEEIRSKIETAKTDHGALSAIIFLMHFYENGAIHRLEPYKLCAVELAGLAIYNHTAKYKHCDAKLKKEDIAYYKISFVLNPISYLLRISDDMQEWDRIYFEISNNSNLIICRDCKTPILRAMKNNEYYYQCNCNSIIDHTKADVHGPFSTVFKYDAFPYRRIYNVTVCDKLSWINSGSKILFKLHYNLENLLHVAYINSSYAKYRIKELNQMKRLFDLQSMMPNAYIEYFVSANPILIKVKIIEAWLEAKHKDVLDSWWESFKKKVEEDEDTSDLTAYFELQFEGFNEIFELSNRYDVKFNKAYNDKLLTYMQRVLNLYGCLCWFMSIYQRVNSKELVEDTTKAKTLLKKVEEQYRESLNEEFYSGNAECLINDSFMQIKRLYKDITRLDACPKDYYMQFEEDENFGISLYDSCDSFTLAKNYKPINTKTVDIKIDAFTDLALFQGLMKELRE